MEIVLTLLCTAAFSYVVFKNKFFSTEGISAKTSVLLFNLKVAAGIALALIYTFYYTDRSLADIYKYFDDGQIIANLFLTDPLTYFQIVSGIHTDTPEVQAILNSMRHWYKVYESPLYNDNRTIIRFNAIAHLISFGSIGVHTVIMAFLSYTGLLALYKFSKTYVKGKDHELILVIFLLPSVIFWGSGVLKEGILLFAMGSVLYLWDKLLKDSFNWKRLILFFFAVWLLALSKMYVFLALAGPMIAFSWIALTGEKKVVLKYGIVASVCIIIVLILNGVLPDRGVFGMIAEKQKDFINLAIEFEVNSYYEIPVLEPNIWSFLKAAPIAFFNVLARPHLLEAGNAMMLAAALENLLILSLMLLFIIFSKKNLEKWNFLFFCIGFVVILFTLIGMITPILGAVVRYKIPGLPLILIACLYMFDKEKFIAKFPVFKFLNR
ncbi:MAG: hypothetical protein JKX73_02150 [Flavobacteriales bacterium]|nr:hypothetical protein [Flavobacteriales bacterium]